ncbi:MAG: cobalamin-dependent protein [Candidatus Cloacimonetes bacterium]|nr:cobalamin-dependent protein [Candidatus Cloacimonadota bacterium]
MDTIQYEAMSDEQVTLKAINIFYDRYPEYEKRYGEKGRKRAYKDWMYHLSYLSSAINIQESNLFLDYVAWCKMFFKSIHFPEVYLIASFEILADIYEQDNSDYGRTAYQYLSKVLERFPSLPNEINPFIQENSELGVMAQQYLNSLLRGERNYAEKIIFDAIEKGIFVKDIYLKIFQPVQYEVGRLWQLNVINVAMEHFCTAATQNIIARLYSHIFTGQKGNKKLISTSVSGELHELGIRMVTDFFEMEGWDTYYLGANTPHDSIIAMIENVKPDIIAVSATIAFNVDRVRELIFKIRENVSYNDYRIIVGGYPFNKNEYLWETVGADSFAINAEDAILSAQKLIDVR